MFPLFPLSILCSLQASVDGWLVLSPTCTSLHASCLTRCPALSSLPVRHTKLVTLKPKYIIENQTGLTMAVKQLGGPDPMPHGIPNFMQRFACILLPNQRCAP